MRRLNPKWAFHPHKVSLYRDHIWVMNIPSGESPLCSKSPHGDPGERPNIAMVSLYRDLLHFWNARQKLLPPKAALARSR